MRGAWRNSWWLVLAAALVAGSGLRAGELDQVRESVRSPSESSASEATPPSREREKPRRARSEPRFECDDDDRWTDSDGLKLTGVLIASPFWLPHLALDDTFLNHGYVVAAPYEDASAAMLTTADPDVRMPAVFGRLQLDTLTDFGDLGRVGGNALIEVPQRFGVDTSFGYWHERLDGGSNALWLGDFNLVYRFAQSSRAQFRAGLGTNWLADDRGADFGVNFTYGFDFFPAKPWVMTQTFDMGTLGSASLARSQTTVGIVRHQWELFTGLELTRIGRADLTGWTNGVRVRF
ncbi:MAG: hypothetical protein IT428_01220 [Planctomycetaceae bacterium]|nr:hypothetical protein [Planctomycetaceae bacterium]